MIRRIALSVLVVAGVLAVPPARAAVTSGDPAFVEFQGGYFDFNRQKKTAGSFALELHPDLRWTPASWFNVAPFVGAMGTTDSAGYVYGGFGLEFALTQHLLLVPNAAVGYYGHGSGKDLGSTTEFRTGGELDYRFDSGWRIGASFHHISNAGIGEHNPGTEIGAVTLSIPLGHLFAR